MAYTTRSATTPFKSLDDVSRFLQEEFSRIAVSLSETTAVELRMRGAAPLKPRDGMIASADGVGWNPGAGPGAYEYFGGTWHKL